MERSSLERAEPRTGGDPESETTQDGSSKFSAPPTSFMRSNERSPGLSASEFRHLSDLRDGHRLAFDLMAYGSTKFPAFDGTLGELTANILTKLSDFALRARRVLEAEIPDETQRLKLLIAGTRFNVEGSPHAWRPHPVVHALNGIIHGKEIWINHLYDKRPLAWEPTGSIVMLGFGTVTDKHRLDHVDLFGLALGFLNRPSAPSQGFLARINQ